MLDPLFITKLIVLEQENSLREFERRQLYWQLQRSKPDRLQQAIALIQAFARRWQANRQSCPTRLAINKCCQEF
jgi:endonuclease III-like uncharacterized protein